MPRILWLWIFLLVLPCILHADLYQWQDQNGGWHIADDIGKVPSEYRDGMKVREVPEVEESSTKEETKSTKQTKNRETKQKKSEPKKYAIPYQRRPGVLYVNPSINGRSPVSLILDTGASFTVLSRATAKKLGISLKGVLPRIRTSTANGVTGNYLVRLSSVQLGDARVENIAALVPVRSHIGVNGLLGQNFLNEFEWANDTTRGVLVLKEPSNLPGEEIYGGHGRMWWERKFETANQYLADELQQLKAMKDYDPDGPMEEDFVDQEIKIQKANVKFFQKELEILDTKANRYTVPRSWR